MYLLTLSLILWIFQQMVCQYSRPSGRSLVGKKLGDMVWPGCVTHANGRPHVTIHYCHYQETCSVSPHCIPTPQWCSVYSNIYTSLYIHETYIRMYMCIYIHIHMHMCMHVCIHAYIYVCMYVMHASRYVHCMYVCMHYAYVYLC